MYACCIKLSNKAHKRHRNIKQVTSENVACFYYWKIEDKKVKIGEIAFDMMESVRKKCITFAKDGKTVVKPYRTLYNLEYIYAKDVLNESYKNLYLEVINDKFGETKYQIWEDLQVVCVSLGWVREYIDTKEFSECLLKYPYLGIDGFYKRLEEAEQNGRYINKVDIEACILLENFDLAKHYSEYREKQIAEIEAERLLERAEYEQKEREKQEKRLMEIETVIKETEENINHQIDVNNIEVDGKSVINKLMEKYGISVPLRTKGWINSKLAMIIFDGGKISYKFYGKTQREDSKVFMKYLIELENAIDEELALPFC